MPPRCFDTFISKVWIRGNIHLLYKEVTWTGSFLIWVQTRGSPAFQSQGQKDCLVLPIVNSKTCYKIQMLSLFWSGLFSNQPPLKMWQLFHAFLLHWLVPSHLVLIPSRVTNLRGHWCLLLGWRRCSKLVSLPIRGHVPILVLLLFWFIRQCLVLLQGNHKREIPVPRSLQYSILYFAFLEHSDLDSKQSTH